MFQLILNLNSHLIINMENLETATEDEEANRTDSSKVYFINTVVCKKNGPCAKKVTPCAKKRPMCKKSDTMCKKNEPCAKKVTPCAKKMTHVQKKWHHVQKKDPCPSNNHS